MKQPTYRYLGSADNPRTLVVDDDTALWCARMLVGEAGKIHRDEASAMLWAMLNRWFLHPGRRHWPTFLDMIRRFSQPINPDWQRGGRLAKKHAGTIHCTRGKLTRRELICSLDWDSPALNHVAEYIVDFQLGILEPPEELFDLDKPRISNWASYKGLPDKYPWGISFEKNKRKRFNWFFEDKRLIAGHVVSDYWMGEV